MSDATIADRKDSLLRGVNKDARILELGASVAPLTPRSAGWNCTVVDHASQDELVEKYRTNPDVDITAIEKVDIVWRNGSLDEAVPAERLGTFDVLIASHVIEHLPDPIGFFKSASRILNREGGVLVMAVPDKRWCFDCLKQVSSTGQFLAAHRMGAQRHGLVARFDHSAYIAFDNGRGGWGREWPAGLKLADTLEHAYSEFESWTADPHAPYVDSHAWAFTPASFELLVLEASAVGLIDWRISWIESRPGVEFLAHLVPGRQRFESAADREECRLKLLKQILLDTWEQTNLLVEASKPRQEPADPAVGAIALQREPGTITQGPYSALRALDAIWCTMLPVRRQVARWRGRI
jgi:SAM-dependent methyltransferase